MKYQIIYADPSWQYRDKALAGNRGAECKYPVQSLEWIKNLPIHKISDHNCALFLWITMPLLPVVWDVIKAWGFEYKTVAFNWIKINPKAQTVFWGMGNYTRACSELCLLGVKGKPKRFSASVHSVIHSPIKTHSEKPDEIRDRIVQLMGDVPRIELFARKKVEGWSTLGLDVDGKDLYQSINEIAELNNVDEGETQRTLSL